MAQQSNSLREDIRRGILGEGEDKPVGIQPGGLPTNGGNKPLAEANIEPQTKKGSPALNIAQAVFEALERFGAGFQGKEDPVTARKQKQARLTLDQETFNALEAATRFKAADSLLKGAIQARKEGLDLEVVSRFYVPQLKALGGVDIDEESFIEMFGNDKSVAVLESVLDENGLGGLMGDIPPQTARKILGNRTLMNQFLERAEKIGGRAGVQEVIKLKEQDPDVKIETSLDLLTKTKFGQFMTDEQKLIFGIETTETAQKRQEQGVKPQQAASPAGKVIEDRALFVKQYGENSPQVTAFDEASSGGEAPKLSDERGIRQEFTKASGEFVKVRDSFGRIQAVSSDPSPAGDLALIFNFMKMLDPGSVVRESEFATAENTAGVPTRIRNIYNKILSGEKLAPQQRADFLEQANNLFQSQLRFQQRLVKQFKNIAILSKIDPNKVIVDFIGQVGISPSSINPPTPSRESPPLPPGFKTEK